MAAAQSVRGGIGHRRRVRVGVEATIDEVQESFDARLERDYAPLRAALKTPTFPEDATVEQLREIAIDNPGSFGAQMRLALALREAGESRPAIEALERASVLLPAANGQANPNALIASIALEGGGTERAIRALEAVLTVDASDVESARQLAALLEPTGDAARTGRCLRARGGTRPLRCKGTNRRGTPGAGTARFGDGPTGAPFGAGGRASGSGGGAPRRGEAYLMAGQLDDAKREIIAALEIAPSFERAQELLLDTITAQAAEDAP